MKTTIFELIRQAELLNSETTIFFLNRFSGDIGISHILVLMELRENGPQMQSVLAKKFGYTPGGMTSIASKLIKQHYAVREYDPSDRRIVRLASTEQGLEILARAQHEGQELGSELYSVLSEEEMKQMINIQKKLFLHLKEMNKR